MPLTTVLGPQVELVVTSVVAKGSPTGSPRNRLRPFSPTVHGGEQRFELLGRGARDPDGGFRSRNGAAMPTTSIGLWSWNGQLNCGLLRQRRPGPRVRARFGLPSRSMTSPSSSP